MNMCKSFFLAGILLYFFFSNQDNLGLFKKKLELSVMNICRSFFFGRHIVFFLETKGGDMERALGEPGRFIYIFTHFIELIWAYGYKKQKIALQSAPLYYNYIETSIMINLIIN